MRISDWSSDVCSSDLVVGEAVGEVVRDRERVTGALGVDPQRPGHPSPVGECAEAQADPDPALGHPAQVQRAGQAPQRPASSEERRVGKEGVGTCRSWWARYHSKKKKKEINEGN